MKSVSYLHPFTIVPESVRLPEAFTFPFRYTPHPLCRLAANMVQDYLKTLDIQEGKMYGVLIVEVSDSAIVHPTGDGKTSSLAFLAAYSGQLQGSYDHPWFVPPIVDYLHPDSYFQHEQAAIMELSRQMEHLRHSDEYQEWQATLHRLTLERDAAVAHAKEVYAQGKRERERIKEQLALYPTPDAKQQQEELIRQSQQQKADIQRAKHLHQMELSILQERLTAHNNLLHDYFEQRKRRSEQLQDWLFEQFHFLNARGEEKRPVEIWHSGASSLSDLRASGKRVVIPSGAGECCAPKLLQAAYDLHLKPVAMAEFWWGASTPGHYREPGAFFPACRSKCVPILGHMLQGLNVEPDPADHYESRHLKPIRVLWEDEHLAVLVKPEGWVSIPGKSDQPCVLDECFRRWPSLSGPVIVHRLDMDTSGLLVVAKHAQMHRLLSQLFEHRQVQKQYIAILERSATTTIDINDKQRKTISLPLGPDLDDLPRQCVDFVHGKEAITDYKVLGEDPRGIRVAFYPQTGRTHQLRLHAASPQGLGSPIVGDRLYGKPSERLYLHAASIRFIHPLTHQSISLTAETDF